MCSEVESRTDDEGSWNAFDPDLLAFEIQDSEDENL
jgi:hypothetical protein